MEEPSVQAISTDLEEHLPEIQRRYGVARIQVYGSIARGEGEPESDVDLLVTFSRTPTLFEMARLQEDLEDLLEREVDITTPGGLHPRVLAAASADAVEVGPGA